MDSTVRKSPSPPLVSVIVPIFNMEARLNRCIDSILQQSFADLEIILVDDGSTDGSLQICENYAKGNDRIIVIKKENGGLSSARLAGFDQAGGKYILFADSDDYMHEDMIRQLVDSIESCGADLAMCEYYEKRDQAETRKTLPFREDVIQGRKKIVDDYIKPLIGRIGKETWLPGFIWIRLMKRELIQADFFRSEKEFFMEDHVFDLLYADHIQTISIVRAPLYYYCINQNSLTNRYRENKWDMYMNLRDFYLSFIGERKIDDCQKRMESFLLSAFCSAVDNAALSGSYREYTHELKKITKSMDIRELKGALREQCVPATNRMTYFLYRFRLLLPLYYLRRARLSHV